MDDDWGDIFGAIIGFFLLIGLVKMLIEIVIAIVIAVATIIAVVGVIYLIYREVLAYMKKNVEEYIAEREEDLRIHSVGTEKLDLGDYHDIDQAVNFENEGYIGRQYKKLQRGNKL